MDEKQKQGAVVPAVVTPVAAPAVPATPPTATTAPAARPVAMQQQQTEREPLLYVVIGKKKIGKTYTTMQYLRKYVVGANARRALIFDSNNEFVDVKSIDIMQLDVFSRHPLIELRRVLPFLPNRKEMTSDQKARAVLYILEHFRNGLLLLEDINNYIGDNINSDVIGTILAQRHKGIDMMLHYHSMGRIQKKVWPHINWIRMHKCGDSVRQNKDKFQDKYEMFQIAENIVNAQFNKGNMRFYLFIDCDMDKIHASVSAEERDEAIKEYIGEFHSQLLNPMLIRIDEAGERKYTLATAFQTQENRILSQYFSE